MIPFAANALQCIVNKEEKTPKLSLPLGISSPCRGRTEPRPQATCEEKLVKIARVVPEICWRTDRQTDRQTDVLIRILRYRSRGRSKYRSYICEASCDITRHTNRPGFAWTVQELARGVTVLRYGDGAGNTVEENSSVFSLIRMR